MPLPIVAGLVTIAVSPKVRGGVKNGINGVRNGVNNVKCTFSRCNFVVPDVQFQQDPSTGNVTISDLNFTFGVSETLNKFKTGKGAPCGIPTVQFELCNKNMAGLVITSSVPEPNTVQFDGVPKSCMDLSKAMVASCAIGPQVGPITCGEACLKYSDLSAGQLAQLTSILKSA